MKKAYRLKNRGSFTYIYRKGTSLSTSILVLLHVPSHSLRMGVSVSKKIGKSVVRNKVKRRINESFCRLAPHITGQYNYIAVAREPIAKATFLDILKSMEYLLKKAGHIPNDLELKTLLCCTKGNPEDKEKDTKDVATGKVDP
ncbi:MAG: Ribonuclease P protein component [Firmicutes bacterium ADurb.Bin080]|jgi:ribonuclease P protein component|nr:ribonuclease P protein component [Clostridiales bacterium]OQC15440.1 MAG: Ribonuclease P protein component [Firmicutes bacterium ADurb.Bin080]